MRRLIALLLILSLSSVSTGYACRMDGLNVVRAVCCCPHARKAPDDAAPALGKASVGRDHDSKCCDVVVDAALDDQQPGLVAPVPALDLPAIALLPATDWNQIDLATASVAKLPPARGPPLGSGTRTYLTTARLRI